MGASLTQAERCRCADGKRAQLDRADHRTQSGGSRPNKKEADATGCCLPAVTADPPDRDGVSRDTQRAVVLRSPPCWEQECSLLVPNYSSSGASLIPG